MFQSKEPSFQIKLGLMQELKYNKNLVKNDQFMFFTALTQGRTMLNVKQQCNIYLIMFSHVFSLC